MILKKNVLKKKNWATAPKNTEKARKKRSQRRSVPKISPDHLINYIYNLAPGGTICAGHSCSQTLWLYTGPSEFDIRTDLQYCNLACSRNNLTGNLHYYTLSPRNILPFRLQPIQNPHCIRSIALQTAPRSNKKPCAT